MRLWICDELRPEHTLKFREHAHRCWDKSESLSTWHLPDHTPHTGPTYGATDQALRSWECTFDGRLGARSAPDRVPRLCELRLVRVRPVVREGALHESNALRHLVRRHRACMCTRPQLHGELRGMGEGVRARGRLAEKRRGAGSAEAHHNWCGCRRPRAAVTPGAGTWPWHASVPASPRVGGEGASARLRARQLRHDPLRTP